MIDKQICKATAAKAVDALQALAKEYGFVVSYSGGRYSSSEMTIKIKFKEATTLNPEFLRDRWNKRAPLYGLKASNFHQVFNSRGQRYRLVGFREGSRSKYNVETVRLSDGKTFFFQDRHVMALVNPITGNSSLLEHAMSSLLND